MQAFRIIVLTALVSGMGGATAASEKSPYVQHQNIVYGEVHGIGLLMDVFVPTGDTNGLGVIDVMSGAWHSDRGKIRDHDRAQTFNILCGKGYTVFAVRPGSVTKFTALEMLDHLNRGIRWVKSHAADYKVDPDCLGLMGASAGGHLACLAAVTADTQPNSSDPDQKVSTSVNAVAVFFPPTDFLNYGGEMTDARSESGRGKLIRALAFPKGVEGLSDEEIKDALIQISPARLVTPQSPPFLLIHGDADPDVPLQQSQRMLDELKKAGVPAELIVKPGGGHPWPTIHEEVRVLADWFDKQLLPE
jgi:acetyl esterase/lipase